MRRFLKIHYEKILVLLALVLAAAIITYYIWVARIMVVALGKALAVQGGQVQNVSFDIQGAARLNLVTDF